MPLNYWKVSFNPSGTHFHKEKLKIRLDIDPLPPNPLYDEYQKGTEYARNMAHFAEIAPNTSRDRVINWINDVLTSEVLSSLEEAILGDDPLHLIVPLMRGKTVIEGHRWTEHDNNVIIAFNTAFAGVSVEKGQGQASSVRPESIDVGIYGGNEVNTYDVSSWTMVNKANSANATGTLESARVYVSSRDAGSDLWVGIFSASGDVLTCRDSESTGTPSVGGNTLSGLDISTVTGDYIGCYSKSGSINVDRSTSGDGIWYKAGEYIDPEDTDTFSTLSDRDLSLDGSGTESSSSTMPISASDLLFGGVV